MVPHRFGIDDRDRAARADTEAVRLGPVNQRFGPGQGEFIEPFFEVIPRFHTCLERAALRFGLVGAQENVPAIMLETQELTGLI